MPLAHLIFALLELEPQRSDNSVGVLVVIVLSASRQAVMAAVVAAVLWPTIDVAVRWFVAVFVESVLTSLSWVTAVQSDLVVSVVVHVAFSSSDPLHMFLSAGDAIRTCSFAHLFAVALCGSHSLLPSTLVTLEGSIQWPRD